MPTPITHLCFAFAVLTKLSAVLPDLCNQVLTSGTFFTRVDPISSILIHLAWPRSAWSNLHKIIGEMPQARFA